MTATVPLPVSVSAGTRLLGEVIAWACPGLSIPHFVLVETLRESGLDESVARELAPRHAFARACKKLSDARIIRPVAEDATAVTFQFTAESRSGDRFEYELETMLRLDKQTGKVSCDLPGLGALAQDELDRCVQRAKDWQTERALFGALHVTSAMFADARTPVVHRAMDALLDRPTRQFLVDKVLPDPTTEPSGWVSGRRVQIRRKFALIDRRWRRVAFVGAVHTGSGTFVGTGATGGKSRPIHLLPRGDVTKPGKEVQPGAIVAVP